MCQILHNIVAKHLTIIKLETTTQAFIQSVSFPGHIPAPREVLVWCQRNPRRCKAVKTSLALSSALPAVAAGTTAVILELSEDDLDEVLTDIVTDTIDKVGDLLNVTVEEATRTIEEEAENVFAIASIYSAGLDGLDRTNRANGRPVLHLEPLSNDPTEPEFLSLAFDLAQNNSKAEAYLRSTEDFRKQHGLTYLDHSSSDSLSRQRRDMPSLSSGDLLEFQAKLDATRKATIAAEAASDDPAETQPTTTAKPSSTTTPAPPTDKNLLFLQMWNKKLNTCERRLDSLRPLVHSLSFDKHSSEEAYRQAKNRLQLNKESTAKMVAAHAMEKDKMAASLSSVSSKLMAARAAIDDCEVKRMKPTWPRDLFIASLSVAATLLSCLITGCVAKIVQWWLKRDPYRARLIDQHEQMDLNNRNAGPPRQVLHGHHRPDPAQAQLPPDQAGVPPAPAPSARDQLNEEENDFGNDAPPEERGFDQVDLHA